jgi:hypothetical protein
MTISTETKSISADFMFDDGKIKTLDINQAQYHLIMKGTVIGGTCHDHIKRILQIIALSKDAVWRDKLLESMRSGNMQAVAIAENQAIVAGDMLYMDANGKARKV